MSDKFLVIDDDPSFCALIERFCQKIERQALTFSSIAELKNSDENFDNTPVAFVDYDLGGETGHEAAEYLRQANKDISIVLISGVADDELGAHAETMAADFFMPKPLPFPLFNVVQENAVQTFARKRQVSGIRAAQLNMLLLQEWYFDQISKGSLPSVTAFYDYVGDQIEALFKTNSAGVLVRVADSLVWRVVANRGLGTKWQNARLMDESGEFEGIVGNVETVAFEAGSTTLTGPLFRAWNRHHMAFVPLRFEFQRRDIVWMLARTGTQTPFAQWEVQLLNQLASFFRAVFETVFGYHDLMQRTASYLETELSELSELHRSGLNAWAGQVSQCLGAAGILIEDDAVMKTLPGSGDSLAEVISTTLKDAAPYTATFVNPDGQSSDGSPLAGIIAVRADEEQNWIAAKSTSPPLPNSARMLENIARRRGWRVFS